VSICPAVIRRQGEPTHYRAARSQADIGHDHEELLMYVPYQFLKSLHEETLRVAAGDQLAATARSRHGRTRRTSHRLVRILLLRATA
jgi:hypothetical protein